MSDLQKYILNTTSGDDLHTELKELHYSVGTEEITVTHTEGSDQFFLAIEDVQALVDWLKENNKKPIILK